MKLISMTDFVCENTYKWELILNYANFLKQTLELGMFVPCDEEGSILEEKEIIDFHPKDWNEINNQNQKYQQAKEKVFFQGCIYDDKMDAVRDNIGLMMYSVKYESNDAIEDLVKYNLTLTDSAIKKLGL